MEAFDIFAFPRQQSAGMADGPYVLQRDASGVLQRSQNGSRAQREADRIGLCSGAHDDFGEIIDTVRSSEHSFNTQPTARNFNKPTSTLCLGQNGGVHTREFGDLDRGGSRNHG